jgi:acetyltransferase-like isoleucine patch superfamily enzyme
MRDWRRLFVDGQRWPRDPERRHEPGKTAPILLEENVWLGTRVTILKGAGVGRGGDVANGDIAVGNPARRVGSADA